MLNDMSLIVIVNLDIFCVIVFIIYSLEFFKSV